jgi:aconitase A
VPLEQAQLSRGVGGAVGVADAHHITTALHLRIPSPWSLGDAAFRNQVYLSRRKSFTLMHGHVVIAAITSCTNINPGVMLAAGLLAPSGVARDAIPCRG